MKITFDIDITEMVDLKKEECIVDMFFSFAKYLRENYDYIDNTESGDMYRWRGDDRMVTEKAIFNVWKRQENE